MKVLVITGDKNFKPGNERYELQRSVVDELAVVYWGRGSLRPALPVGQFDVVTVQDPFWRGLFAMRVARKLRARFNVQVHADLAAQPFFRHIIAQIVVLHADCVRVVSEKIKKQVEGFGVKARVSVLPIFVDIDKFRSITRVPHEGKQILWLGRFEDEKNPLEAIEVLKSVRAAGVEAQLTMLGAGSLQNQILSSAQGLPVEVLSWRDPSTELARADVVLSTSRHESWGASIVEALAAGVPVVAPDVGVAREAGAIVIGRNDLAKAVVTVLKEGSKGTLLLSMPTREEWAAAWKNTLSTS